MRILQHHIVNKTFSSLSENCSGPHHKFKALFNPCAFYTQPICNSDKTLIVSKTLLRRSM